MLLSLAAAISLVLAAFGSPTLHEHLGSSTDLRTHKASKFSSRDRTIGKGPKLYSRNQTAGSIAQLVAAAQSITPNPAPALPNNETSKRSVRSIPESKQELSARQSPAIFSAEGVTFGPGNLMSFAWDFNNVTHNLTFDGNMCATDVLDNWEAPDGLVSDVTLEEIWEEISALDPDELYNYTLTTLQAESAQLNATYNEYFCSGPPVLNCEGRCLPSSASTTSEPPLRHAHLTTVMVRTAGVYLVALMVELFGEFFTTSHGGSAAVYAIVPVLVVFLNDYIIYLQRRGAVGRAEGYLASVYASTAGFIRQQAAGTTHGSCVQLANLEDIVVDPQSSSDGMSEISFMDALYESEMPSLRGDECV